MHGPPGPGLLLSLSLESLPFDCKTGFAKVADVDFARSQLHAIFSGIRLQVKSASDLRFCSYYAYLLPRAAYGRIDKCFMARVSTEISEYLRTIGKKGGEIGGKKAAEVLGADGRKRRAKKASDAVMKALTPAQRKLRAKKAAQARWAKAKKKGAPKQSSDE